MAKISFTKLGLKVNSDVKMVSVGDLQIEVKQFLPVAEKIKFIEEVVNKVSETAAAAGYQYVNWAQANILRTICYLKYYTNISFTEKQLEDVYKIYDVFVSTEVYDTIYNTIPAKETLWIDSIINAMIETTYKYKTSALGIMETIGTDYKDVEFDTEKLRENIGDKENLGFLREVLEKMG